VSGRTSDEGRYSKVSRRMWTDERFRKLSKPKPNAQTLWQRLLTGPELGCVPGLFRAREGGIADDLGWSVKAFRKCWNEIATSRMAEADWAAGLVWVPNAIVHNEPQSTNTIIGWRLALLELPECDLKRRALAVIREHLEGMGVVWVEAFEKATAEAKSKPRAMPSPMAKAKPSGKPSRIQEQEQDKEERDQRPPISKDLTGTGAQEAPPTTPTGLGFEDAAETICPLNLLEQAKAAGVFEAIHGHLGCEVRALEHHAHEFVSFWTIGKGMGRRKRLWVRELRQRLITLHHEGKLAVPGERPVDPERAALGERRAAAQKAAEERRIAELNERARALVGDGPVNFDLKALIAGIGGNV